MGKKVDLLLLLMMPELYLLALLYLACLLSLFFADFVLLIYILSILKRTKNKYTHVLLRFNFSISFV